MTQKFRSTAVSYTVIDQLGEGLNSVVYKAIRSDPFRHLQQTVALKVLKSKNSVDIWKKEFASLINVHSPHCVRVFGFEWVNSRPALVLEYVHGVSLRHLCEAGPVDQKLASEILRQIQIGLDGLHERGLCHGDLSPNNVMIDRSGCVKLLDFGWANHSHSSIRTTPQFAAPELLNGTPPSRESDLYSLGVLEKILLHRESSRLHRNRSCRERYNEPSNSQGLLAERVQQLMDHQHRFRNLKTKPIISVKPKNRWQPTLFMLTAGLMLLAPKSQNSATPEHQSKLSIRSLRWLHLNLDGTDVGFAPQDILIKPCFHILSWQTEEQSGQTNIPLEANKAKIITDTDL
jgi:serine/threonine protein kinase